MKPLILFISIFSIICEVDILKQQKIVNEVNKLKTTWTAELNQKEIEVIPLDYLEQPKNLDIPLKTKFSKELSDLPESFDLRDKFPNCETLKEIRDQSKCGSCWAFGSVETMSDRICIYSDQKLQIRLSALHLISCCDTCGNGCFGGYPSSAFDYWKRKGIPSGGNYNDKSTCKPYFLPPCEDHPNKCIDYVDTPNCEDKCQDEYPIPLNEDLNFAKEIYSISGEENIMKEIYTEGPVATLMIDFTDFSSYKTGIYQHVTGEACGIHCIKIIGWGVENGIKYWIMQNSWGENWGEKGYFRMLRGTNECGIESMAYAGIPKFE